MRKIQLIGFLIIALNGISSPIRLFKKHYQILYEAITSAIRFSLEEELYYLDIDVFRKDFEILSTSLNQYYIFTQEVSIKQKYLKNAKGICFGVVSEIQYLDLLIKKSRTERIELKGVIDEIS